MESELWSREFAKAEFTHPISRKIRRTKKYCGIPQNTVFAKAEFANLNFTKKVRILFVESKVEVDYVCESGIHKSKFHKKKSAFYLWNPGWKWTCESGIDFPQNTWPVEKKRGWDNLWSRFTKFENIVEFGTFILLNSTIFLGPTYFLLNRMCEFRFRRYSNKGHEFHNIFEFCGTVPQIIPTHVFFRLVKYFVENWFLFRKSISILDSTNKMRTFFCGI